ncbi:MAG: hypothetical protein ABIA63_15075, partial [bacterium]
MIQKYIRKIRKFKTPENSAKTAKQNNIKLLILILITLLLTYYGKSRLKINTKNTQRPFRCYLFCNKDRISVYIQTADDGDTSNLAKIGLNILIDGYYNNAQLQRAIGDNQINNLLLTDSAHWLIESAQRFVINKKCGKIIQLTGNKGHYISDIIKKTTSLRENCEFLTVPGIWAQQKGDFIDWGTELTVQAIQLPLDSALGFILKIGFMDKSIIIFPNPDKASIITFKLENELLKKADYLILG